jgi:DNA-directed RNA polymerase specialized sigma24 family protein|tara:strand:+ start:146 stop:604 length:459 start_codon:yes stop_codon:yes gene_type:complete
MLDKLSEQHSKWINFAFKISKNKNTAHDLVQDMYLKVHCKEIPEHKLTDTYIYIILLNDFRESIKKNKFLTVSTDDCYNLIDDFNAFELDDKGVSLITKFKGLTDKEKRVLINTLDMPLRAIAEKEKTNFVEVFWIVRNARLKLLGHKYFKK